VRFEDPVHHAVNDAALDTLFRAARSHNRWLDKPVTPPILMALYDLLRWGPTSANSSPARFLFLTTPAAKERLKPHLGKGNIEKVMTAPVCVIVGYDLDFAETLPKLYPYDPNAKNWFKGEEHNARTAFRNGTLQGAYLIMAARAVGLDAGPMSGFDNDGVDREFFPDGRVKSNFLCALGYGDARALIPRQPRLSFDEACKLL
jgi:3-hydroxypropanoate dehydrogenase